MLSQRRATAWTIVLSVWTGPVWVPLDSKLPRPGVELQVLTLKTAREDDHSFTQILPLCNLVVMV